MSSRAEKGWNSSLSPESKLPDTRERPLLTCVMIPSFDLSLSHELRMHFCHRRIVIVLIILTFTILNDELLPCSRVGPYLCHACHFTTQHSTWCVGKGSHDTFVHRSKATVGSCEWPYLWTLDRTGWWKNKSQWALHPLGCISLLHQAALHGPPYTKELLGKNNGKNNVLLWTKKCFLIVESLTLMDPIHARPQL